MAVKRSNRAARKIRRRRVKRRVRHTRPALQRARRAARVAKRSLKRPWQAATSAYPFSTSRKRSRYLKHKGSSEYSKAKYVAGRSVKVLSVSKLNKISTESRIYRWQRLGNYERVGSGIPGGLNLQMLNGGTAEAPNWWFPVHLYLLNCVQQYEQGVGGISEMVSRALRLQGNNYYWDTTDMVGQDGIGGLNGYFNLESSDTLGSDEELFLRRRYVQQKWYDIRMMLYNATSQPTRFMVELVSFTKDHLDPLEVVSNDKNIEERNRLYASLSRTLVSHPLATIGSRSSGGGIRVHWRKLVDMTPQSTSDSDTSPNHQDLRLFYRDGRVYDYSSYPEQFSSAAQFAVDPSRWQRRGDQNSGVDRLWNTKPRPKARMYLMIRAFDHTFGGLAPTGADGGNSTASSSANTPSYDIVIRKKEVSAAV